MTMLLDICMAWYSERRMLFTNQDDKQMKQNCIPERKTVRTPYNERKDTIFIFFYSQKEKQLGHHTMKEEAIQ
jgi:hypothetical protein